MAGKNKIERGIKVLVDDSGGTARDLTTDLIPGSLSGLGVISGEIDMSGVTQDKNYLADVSDTTLTMNFHMNNTAATGATTVLNGIVGGAAVTVTIQFGENGVAPDTGDPEWEGEYICMSAPVSADGGRLIHSCTFRPTGSTAPAWGTVA